MDYLAGNVQLVIAIFGKKLVQKERLKIVLFLIRKQMMKKLMQML